MQLGSEIHKMGYNARKIDLKLADYVEIERQYVRMTRFGWEVSVKSFLTTVNRRNAFPRKFTVALRKSATAELRNCGNWANAAKVRFVMRNHLTFDATPILSSEMNLHRNFGVISPLQIYFWTNFTRFNWNYGEWRQITRISGSANRPIITRYYPRAHLRDCGRNPNFDCDTFSSNSYPPFGSNFCKFPHSCKNISKLCVHSYNKIRHRGITGRGTIFAYKHHVSS